MSKRTLLLIDVQRNMLLLPPQPVPDAPTVGPEIAQILERARHSGAMVIHVRNNGGKDDPDAPGPRAWN
jgi:nicotinamidase-related amidase